MRVLLRSLSVSLALYAAVVLSQRGLAQANVEVQIQPAAWQIVTLANQARATSGAGPLQWDPALANAARQHCLRMAAEGPISHRYGGEPDLTERAAQAGAHFSLIEENVAIGPDAAAIHDEWMHSPGHRTNLLNPAVDRVGVALVASRGTLYAVADYERAVSVLTQTQIESSIARLLQGRGIKMLNNAEDARSYCALERAAPLKSQPSFLMMWQDADLGRLPQPLLDRIAAGHYRQAEVGSCPAQGGQGAFTAYRIAVLLY
jgi:hypothetical protein